MSRNDLCHRRDEVRNGKKTIPEDAEPLRDPDAPRAERRDRAQGAAAGDAGSRHQTVYGRTESFLSTCPGKVGKF